MDNRVPKKSGNSGDTFPLDTQVISPLCFELPRARSNLFTYRFRGGHAGQSKGESTERGVLCGDSVVLSDREARGVPG